MSNRRRRRKAKASRPVRKTRSLQKDLNLNFSAASTSSPESVESTHTHTHTHTQLNLFPLHPEEKEDAGANVACFFDTDATSTLNGLVWSNNGNSITNISSTSEEETGASSLLLERSALKGVYKERDLSEEKWVCYEEVTSCSVPKTPEYSFKKAIKKESGGGSLLLKLDYEQIISAWSDKGPLCIDGSQIVPDGLDDDPVFMEAGNVPHLRVPDNGCNVEGADGDVWKLESRQARVMRYREKRQNRLFAKRIRYEVRKLNAEKRPRMKGRFVKRVED